MVPNSVCKQPKTDNYSYAPCSLDSISLLSSQEAVATLFTAKVSPPDIKKIRKCEGTDAVIHVFFPFAYKQCAMSFMR